MKEVGNGFFQLELSEIIRANQLVREKIDLEGFAAWHEQLSLPEQLALTGCLCEFAWQAGVDETVWNEAVSAANLKDSLVAKTGSFLRKPHFLDLVGFDNWLKPLEESDRFAIFTFSVHLFGVAEGRVYRNEQKAYCNHWWHRDLLDERVVQHLLNDPQFYSTSMQDDDRIKNKSRWRWLRGG